jgi:hypothetical protein
VCSKLPWVIGLWLLGVAGAWAQDAFRASLAGQAAAEARKQALQNQRYNLKLGPVALRVGAQFSVEATDNVRNTSGDNARSDLIFRPQANLGLFWRVTAKNSLNLSVGAGYVKYLRTARYDGFFVTPDSDLSFDVYVGDFKINLHSRFSYSQEVLGDPTVSGTGRLSRFENTSGVDVLWDLNQFVLTAGYDHAAYLPTESRFSQFARESDLGSLSGALRVRPDLYVGLQVGGGATRYDNAAFGEITHFFSGPFVLVRLNEYDSLRLAGGYVLYAPDHSTITNSASQLNAFYFDLTLQQRLGRLLSHSLSVGRQIQSGFYTTGTDEYYARYGAAWQLFRKTSFTTSFSYQNIAYPNFARSGGSHETIDYYGLGLTLSRPLAQRTTASVGYQFYFRDSSVKGNDYTQNRLVLTVAHAF